MVTDRSVPAEARGHDRAPVPGPVALEDLHRGPLARAVRPEQAEHLTAPDAEIETVRRGDAPVALGTRAWRSRVGIVRQDESTPPS